jgi:hypothetical protein
LETPAVPGKIGFNELSGLFHFQLNSSNLFGILQDIRAAD